MGRLAGGTRGGGDGGAHPQAVGVGPSPLVDPGEADLAACVPSPRCRIHELTVADPGAVALVGPSQRQIQRETMWDDAAARP